MNKFIQNLLDLFYYFRKWVMDGISYFSFRIYGIEVTFEDVQRRSYDRKFENFNLDNVKDLDIIYALAKDRVKEVAERRGYVNDKVKTLIAINAAILALIGLFFQKSTELNSNILTCVFYIGILCIFNAILNLWNYYDLKAESYLDISENEISLDTINLKKSLINDYYFCCNQADNVTDFLADLYKVSRFFMLVGFLCLFVCYSVSYFSKTNIDNLNNVDGNKTVIQVKEVTVKP